MNKANCLIRRGRSLLCSVVVFCVLCCPVLGELDVDDDPVPLISRVGGKAGNLAKLYAFLPLEHQVPAFAIPFRYFELFLESNHIQDSRKDVQRKENNINTTESTEITESKNFFYCWSRFNASGNQASSITHTLLYIPI